MNTRRTALTAAFLSVLAIGSCRRGPSAGACAMASSFELIFVTRSPDYPPEAVLAADHPSAWSVQGRPLLCTEHIAAVSVQHDEDGSSDLILEITDEGRRSLREATKARVGEYIMTRIEGRPHTVARLETPMNAVSKLRVYMRGALETDSAGVNARLRAELARRRSP